MADSTPGQHRLRTNSAMVTSRGAGVILQSPLVYQGHCLSHACLTESDDRFLFDAEVCVCVKYIYPCRSFHLKSVKFNNTPLKVKVKLSHPDSESVLRNVLDDFPPEILLYRAGLIQAVIDRIGAILAYNDKGNYFIVIGQGVLLSQPVLSDSTIGPIFAMEWMESLLSRCFKCHVTNINGNKNSSIPPVFIDECDSSKIPSLSTTMVSLLFSSRFW